MLTFIKNYKELIFLYSLYVVALIFILSHNGCTAHLSQSGAMDKDTKTVRIWTGHDCYYCDKAKEFFKKHEITYVEKNFACNMCRNELFLLANKIKFDIKRIDGVPVIVIGENKIIVGFSKQELECLLINKLKCRLRVFNRGMDSLKLIK